MKLPIIFSFVLVFMIGLFGASDVMAQEKEIHDPLKKPHIWRKLVDTPDDRGLWAEYMGKGWKEMTDEDKRYINKWIKAIVMEAESKINYDDYVATKFNSMDELLTWERMIMEESNRISELKSNVSANFLLIEDMFKEIFEELDRDYKTYDEVHADGNYRQLKWVENHENKITYIKEQIIVSYKKKYGVKN